MVYNYSKRSALHLHQSNCERCFKVSHKMSDDRLFATSYRYEVFNPNAKTLRKALALQRSRIEVRRKSLPANLTLNVFVTDFYAYSFITLNLKRVLKFAVCARFEGSVN